MPCRTYEDDEPTPSKKEDNKWEAGFCALVNLLKKNNSPESIKTILENAGKNSGMDVYALYEEHHTKDVEKLETDLSKYSNDELRLLKELLENKNL